MQYIVYYIIFIYNIVYIVFHFAWAVEQIVGSMTSIRTPNDSFSKKWETVLSDSQSFQ